MAFLLSILLDQYGTLPDGTPMESHVQPDGSAALSWLARQAPASVAVVVLDRQLGQGEDGLDLIPKLRQSHALRPDAVLIVCSALNDPQAAQQARADAFILKGGTQVLEQQIIEVVTAMWQADAEGRTRPWLVHM